MNDPHPGVPALGLLMMIQGVMTSLLAAAIVCSAPIQLMEGEELPVIIFGVTWGLLAGVSGPLSVISGRMLRSYRGRWFALAVTTAQLFLTICFCGFLPLIIWIYAVYLLVFDRRAVASFYAPAF